MMNWSNSWWHLASKYVVDVLKCTSWHLSGTTFDPYRWRLGKSACAEKPVIHSANVNHMAHFPLAVAYCNSSRVTKVARNLHYFLLRSTLSLFINIRFVNFVLILFGSYFGQLQYVGPPTLNLKHNNTTPNPEPTIISHRWHHAE